MPHKTLTTTLFIIFILAVAAGGYWYFFMRDIMSPTVETPDDGLPSAFQPLDRPFLSGDGATSTDSQAGGLSGDSSSSAPLPVLRLLSSTPIGGYGASSTAATTTVRWVDRGRGNIYEADNHSSYIATISNTVVPRIYESIWNRNLTAFIGSVFQDGDSVVSAVHADIVRRAIAPAATGTAPTTAVAPYELRGAGLPDNIIGYATSPDRTRIFMLIEEDGNGVGYTASFDGRNMARIFSTPVTQAVVSWPADNVIAISTKGSSSHAGYLYFVNPQSGIWTKVLGPIAGLTATVSRDARFVLYSSSGGSAGTVSTFIRTVATGEDSDAVIRTLADKCAWGNLYREMVYCGVPSQALRGSYPDSWYTGAVSTSDRIWQVNAATGNTKLVSTLTSQADRAIDAFNVSLDPRDGYLLFMNKSDLSLWSLDLILAD